MRMHFITIPVFDAVEAERALNRFLGAHRVLTVDRQLVQDGAASAWAVCVSYLEGSEPLVGQKPASGRIDYRELLPEAEFAVFAKLRALRKTLAERDGVPPYAVFTNEQLAAMVERKLRTAAELVALTGVGKKRVEKYGPAFLEVLCRSAPLSQTDAGPDAAHEADDT